MLAAGALAAGLCAATALPAAAADLPEPTVTTSGSVSTLEFVSHTVEESFVPAGGSPTKEFPKDMPKTGDGVTFTEDLLQKGTKVGSDTGTCTFASTSPLTLSCDVTMTFAKGTLTFKGTLPAEEDAPFTVPIASGTGAYAGARGEIRVSHIDETDDHNVIAYTTSAEGPAPKAPVVPSGGAGTGSGSTAGTDSPWLFAVGGLAVVVGAGALTAGLRSVRRLG
jgi:hypothetical protein